VNYLPSDAEKALIRAAGGIVHGDGNIFFTDYPQCAAAARHVPTRGPAHQGMKVDYRGMLGQCHLALARGSKKTDLSYMLGELERHLTEMGERYYAGDTVAVDEFLQLYCIARDRRPST